MKRNGCYSKLHIDITCTEQRKHVLPRQPCISHISLVHKTLPQNSGVLLLSVLSNPFTNRLISSSPSHSTHLCSYPHPENNFLPQKPSHNKSNRGLVPTFKLYQLHYLPQILLFIFLHYSRKLFYSVAAPLRRKTKSIKWSVETG
jgi:hypothetical protein